MIGRNTINIPELFQVFTVLPVLTVMTNMIFKINDCVNCFMKSIQQDMIIEWYIDVLFIL